MCSGGSSTTVQKSDPWKGVQPYLTGGSSRTLKPGVTPIYTTTGGAPNNRIGFPDLAASEGTTQQTLANPESDYVTTSTPGIYPEAARIYQASLNNPVPQKEVAPLNPTTVSGLDMGAQTGSVYNNLSQGLADPLAYYGLQLMTGGEGAAGYMTMPGGIGSTLTAPGAAPGGAGMYVGTSAAAPTSQDISPLQAQYNAALTSLMSDNQNPYLEEMAAASRRGLDNQFSQIVMPGINSEASGNGQMGSSRQGVAQGLAAQSLQNSTADMLAALYGNAYNTNQANKLGAATNARAQDVSMKNAQIGANAQVSAANAGAGASALNARLDYDIAMRQLGLQSLNSLGGMQNVGLVGAGANVDAGNTIRGYDQSVLDTGYQNTVARQQYPWQQLNNYASIVQPGAGIGGNTSSTSSQDPSLMQTVGQLGSTAVNAALAWRLFSDIRVKTDIKQVGVLPSGLPIYTFKYKWGGPTQMGVMAQEVEKVFPDAVVEVDGIKMVDYSKVN